ncbi:MAG: FapA family protein [Lachnospiraceae bacterium]|nr:FapA family protein [Lachnospiraceae bacterium]
MVQENGYFQISIRESGTWIVLYPAKETGKPVRFEMVDAFLTKWRVGYDKKVMSDALSKVREKTELRLTTEKIHPMDESAIVELDANHLSAEITLFPPAEGRSTMSRDEIVSELVRVGVKYGLIEERLDELMSKRVYCTPIELAKATPPVEGKNAKITYHFNTDLTLKPKLLEDGSVDFHTLDTICPVKAGDLLAELEPAVQGRPGIDVCGKPIRPMKVNNLILRHANRIHLSEDGLKMYSEVSGHVSLVDDKVFVSDTYEVAADVDSSTGDVVCEGNVEVKGNVRTGFKIDAKGDVIVHGVVEGAEIYAGGQIILMRGIQGMSRGKLIAEGNIISKFIESAEVVSRYGYVHSEAIMHSNVSAKTDVVVGGKKGFISGGSTRCGQMIEAKTVGSNMGTNTLLEVGVDPSIAEEYRRLEKQIPELEQEKESTVQNIVLLAKKLKNGEKLPVEKILLLKNSQKRVTEIEQQLEEIDRRMEELQEDMDMKGNGSIRVSQTAYSGCKITISGAVYYVKSELSHARFVNERGDVKIAAY